MELNSLLGLGCLATLWTLALLVAAAALQDARWLGGLAKGLSPNKGPLQPGLASFSARVESASGAEGQLASLRIEQRGRALDIDGNQALATPRFGSASTAGALISLGFYLGVTPLGVRLHQACAPPHRRLQTRVVPASGAAAIDINARRDAQSRSSASNAA